MSPKHAVKVTGLKKTYGERVALGPIDLKVPAGQQLALVGANGSGKTTLLRIISGLLDSNEGEVEVNGEASGSLDARAAVSYIPDDPVLYDDLSVAEHIEYLAPLYGATEWDEKSKALVDELGLSARVDDLPSGFSRGLRQKTSLLLGFVRPFDILLVDEPFVGLDEPGRNALLAMLDDAKSAGATVIVASHQLELAERADRAIVLREGQIVHDGKPDPQQLASLIG